MLPFSTCSNPRLQSAQTLPIRWALQSRQTLPGPPSRRPILPRLQSRRLPIQFPSHPPLIMQTELQTEPPTQIPQRT